MEGKYIIKTRECTREERIRRDAIDPMLLAIITAGDAEESSRRTLPFKLAPIYTPETRVYGAD